MAITDIRVYTAELPAKRLYNMSSSAVTVPQATIVELIDSSGHHGHGEVCLASPHYQPAHSGGVIASLELLAPAVLGLDPVQHTRVNAALNAALDGHTEGKAAIDIACWDLAGKLFDRHVIDLLGGALSDRVSTYHVVGIGEAEVAAADAAALQDAGLRRLQLKAGGRSIDQDIASIRAVAATLRPDTDLAVDTNRGWSTGEALHVSHACADLRLAFEQPCATEAELRHIKPQLRHPLIVDENATDLATIARLIANGTADGFGLKLSRLGGLTPMLAVRDLCRAARVPMSSDDAWGGDIIAAAGVALGATLAPQFSRGAWLAHPYHQTHYDPEHGPRLDGGSVTVPRGGPGLGLQLEAGCFGDPVAVYTLPTR
ncbi:MAG: mandelate racemase/muconate lactonizing enzyme family protein [Pseudomonadota bacterium]